jgi:hypothetical protein
MNYNKQIITEVTSNMRSYQLAAAHGSKGHAFFIQYFRGALTHTVQNTGNRPQHFPELLL